MKKTLNVQRNLSLAILLIYLFVLSLPIKVLAADQLWSSNTVPSSRQMPRLVDNADILSDSEEKDLIKRFDSLSEKWQCNIVGLTVNSAGGDIQAYADDYFDYNGFGADYNDSGILFMLDMGDRGWCFSTSGDAIQAFTDYGQQYLIDHMMDDLREGYYSDAFETYGKTCDKFLELYSEGKPYDVDSGKIRTKSDYVRFGIYSVIIGLVLALLPILKMKSDLNTVKMNAGASGYQDKNGVKLTRSEDRFVTKTITKTARPKDNGSRGGSGGGSSIHTSSSGSSHGGSSGHF